MTKSTKYFFFATLLLLIGLACSSSTSDPAENSNAGSNDNSEVVSTEAAPAALSLTVTNNSSRTVCALYLTPEDAIEWGEERLGTEVVTAGGSFGLDVSDGSYRVRANDCDGDLIAEYNDFEVDGPTTLSLEDKTVSNTIVAAGEAGTLTVINNTSQDVCYVYISSTEATSWGNDWLSDNQILENGDSETITVGAGLYDLQAADCDGNALAEQYEIDLSTGQTWTLN